MKGTPGRLLSLMRGGKTHDLFRSVHIVVLDEADQLLGSEFAVQMSSIMALMPKRRCAHRVSPSSVMCAFLTKYIALDSRHSYTRTAPMLDVTHSDTHDSHFVTHELNYYVSVWERDR